MFVDKIILLTGVSGSGKTTVGQLLSEKTGIPFFDADGFHPPKNVEKMAAGQPLNDADRAGWLVAIHDFLQKKEGQPVIFACSALKKKYRQTLADGLEKRVVWVFLNGDFDLIRQRLETRKGHFMPSKLLASQFEILELPENALVFDIHFSPEKIVRQLLKQLAESPVFQPSIIPFSNSQIISLSQFGLVGLGVMGRSLARNLARNGFRLALFNRHVAGLEENVAADFIKIHPELAAAQGFDNLQKMVSSLARPRKIMLMVNAGAATDAVIEALKPLISPGDVLLDGGNSFFKDTARRTADLQKLGIEFLGTGVSGGEAGALNGPSIMPGGSKIAFLNTRKFLETIAAKDARGKPCCHFIGAGGAGHFVKMVHNGIEYAEMQLLAEAWFFLKNRHGLVPETIAGLFQKWQNETPLASFLLGITIKILKKKSGDGWLLDEILDSAGSKGTGGWATSIAAELGQPATMISEALFARHLSALKNERVAATAFFSGGGLKSAAVGLPRDSKIRSTRELQNALELARLVNHHQGFELIKAAAHEFGWQISLAEIARIWTNGCIIRSKLMEKLAASFKTGDSILMHPKFQKTVLKNQKSLRQIAASGIQNGLPMHSFSAAANFLNGLTTANSSANLLQAQRDFFGAHTFQKTGDPTGQFFHADWEAAS